MLSTDTEAVDTTAEARTILYVFTGLLNSSWLRFPMKREDRDYTIYEAAQDAIDEDGLARVLAMAADTDELDDEAVAALNAVATDTLVADALAAAAAADWRGRVPTGDDVGKAAERRRSCCDDEPQGPPTIPTSLKVVW